MKKWFITFCALFLFTTQIPAANAAPVNEEGKDDPVLRFIKIIKWESKDGLFVRTIETLSLHNEDQISDTIKQFKISKNLLKKLNAFKAERNEVSDQTSKIPTTDDTNKQPTNNNEDKEVGKTEQPTVPTNNNEQQETDNEKPSTPVTNNNNTTPTSSNNNGAVETTKPAPSTNENLAVSEFEKAVVELTNAERAKAGLAPLQMDGPLMASARAKSADMSANNYFSHTSPTYGSPFDQMRAAGISYRSAGENIAQGQRTPDQVVNGWMNSPGHRANILNASYTHIGVGFVQNGYYWTQQFIQK